MNKNLVSVIVSVFNGADFLEDAISSILNQTHRELELILVDDGSTDNSLEIIAKFAEIDKRIRYISRENRGLSYSLNEAIQLANGYWIARMDADDIAAPERISIQLKKLKDTGADICGAAIKTFGAKISRVIKYPENNEAILTRLLFNSSFAHPTIVGKRSIFLDHLYSEDGVPAEDYELWARMACSGIKLTNCNEVLLNYRIHKNQISNQKLSKQIAIREKVSKDYWRFWGIENNYVGCVSFKSPADFEKILLLDFNKSGFLIDPQVFYSGIFNMVARSNCLSIRMVLRLWTVDDRVNKTLLVKSLLMSLFNRLIPGGGYDWLRIKGWI